MQISGGISMRRYISGLRFLLPLGIIITLSSVFSSNVSADSIISIPVPKNMRNKEVSISLRIPPNTQPLNQKEFKPKLKSRKSLIVWNSNPTPKLARNDELRDIVKTFLKKGWLKSYSSRMIAQSRDIDIYLAVRLIQAITKNVIEIGQTRDFGRVIRKVNLTPSDIQDLRRMVKRFEHELIIFGDNPKFVDKDLLMIQERMKKSRQGILKVLRVEGADDGATIIHLSVD